MQAQQQQSLYAESLRIQQQSTQNKEELQKEIEEFHRKQQEVQMKLDAQRAAFEKEQHEKEEQRRQERAAELQELEERSNVLKLEVESERASLHHHELQLHSEQNNLLLLKHSLQQESNEQIEKNEKKFQERLHTLSTQEQEMKVYYHNLQQDLESELYRTKQLALQHELEYSKRAQHAGSSPARGHALGRIRSVGMGPSARTSRLSCS